MDFLRGSAERELNTEFFSWDGEKVCSTIQLWRNGVYYDARSGQPSVAIDGLAEMMSKKFRESRRFTIRLLCVEFPQRAVQQWLSSLAASSYEECIGKLVSQSV
ncbi:hypothetical protein TNCV_2497271 [Trichonephila clavipes]|nr:hypothetical protein TNCV_2497271 [Trichonephila clavipes]